MSVHKDLMLKKCNNFMEKLCNEISDCCVGSEGKKSYPFFCNATRIIWLRN